MSAFVLPYQRPTSVWIDEGCVRIQQNDPDGNNDDTVELASMDAVRAIIAALQAMLPAETGHEGAS